MVKVNIEYKDLDSYSDDGILIDFKSSNQYTISFDDYKWLEKSNLAFFDISETVEKALFDMDVMGDLKSAFITFKIAESKSILDKTSDDFKEDFYKRLRDEFYLMRLDGETLQAAGLEQYQFYITVLNFETYEIFNNYNLKVRYFHTVNKKELSKQLDSFDELGVTSKKRKTEIVISLTSFPPRMVDIQYCLYSLLKQTLKPDRLVLWLAEEEFPNGEDDVPGDVLRLKRNGLEIKWCSNIRSYKKLLPSLKEFPDSFIVTADDDLFYPSDWLENLWSEYEASPNNVIASRTRRVYMQDGSLGRYNTWELTRKGGEPSYFNFPTGAGGIMYFPNALSDTVFDEELFTQLCPSGDDIWFWAMMVLNKSKIKTIKKPLINIDLINGARDTGILNQLTLWEENEKGFNDVQISNVVERFPQIIEILKSE